MLHNYYTPADLQQLSRRLRWHKWERTVLFAAMILSAIVMLTLIYGVIILAFTF